MQVFSINEVFYFLGRLVSREIKCLMESGALFVPHFLLHNFYYSFMSSEKLLNFTDSSFVFFITDCKKFKDLVEEIAESLTKKEDNETEDSSTAAGLLEKLTVSEPKSEESETTESGTETKVETKPSE